MNYLDLIGRKEELFKDDISLMNLKIQQIVESSRFLIIGGAGSIGQAVSKEIFKRNPLAIHIVDVSENNMVELVRDIRSTLGYRSGDFKTFAVDCGSFEFDSLVNEEGPYDYVFNLSALKHVRSEKDPFTLMRMIMVNVFNTIDTLKLSRYIYPDAESHKLDYLRDKFNISKDGSHKANKDVLDLYQVYCNIIKELDSQNIEYIYNICLLKC